jgi:hypothetical protein
MSLIDSGTEEFVDFVQAMNDFHFADEVSMLNVPFLYLRSTR